MNREAAQEAITTLTTVNAAVGHNRYDVSEFLVEAKVITEKQYLQGCTSVVLVYVVDVPVTVEFYLDRDEAVVAYNDIVDLFSGDYVPAKEKNWSNYTDNLFNEYEA